MELYNNKYKNNSLYFLESNHTNHCQESFVFMNEAEYEYFEERTAIMEYDGGLKRKDAEQIAYKRILQNRKIYSQAS